MSLKLTSLAMLMSLSLMSTTVFAEDLISTYRNHYGSVLKLSNASDNRLHGTFTTAVASADCQKVVGIEKPLIGYQIKNIISFSVAYPECGSVVSFSGYINAENEIDATAIVMRQAETAPDKKLFTEKVLAHGWFKPVKHA